MSTKRKLEHRDIVSIARLKTTKPARSGKSRKKKSISPPETTQSRTSPSLPSAGRTNNSKPAPLRAFTFRIRPDQEEALNKAAWLSLKKGATNEFNLSAIVSACIDMGLGLDKP